MNRPATLPALRQGRLSRRVERFAAFLRHITRQTRRAAVVEALHGELDGRMGRQRQARRLPRGHETGRIPPPDPRDR